MAALNCFKLYDIRGKLGSSFTGEIAFRIGSAVTKRLNAKKIILGYDARESSPSITDFVAKGCKSQGADIIEIGLCGTEEMYWAVNEFGACGGIQITASHNPINYNGLKIVKSEARPLELDTEYLEIKKLSELNKFEKAKIFGSSIDYSEKSRVSYIKQILSFIDLKKLEPIKILLDAGNGAAGPTLKSLESSLRAHGVDCNFVFINADPDHTFPNGIPNPMLKENREKTIESINKHSVDFGVAFDGDFDRCFLFDEKGNFVEADFLISVLADMFIEKENGACIVHDSRQIFAIKKAVKEAGGETKLCQSGHIFFKSAMRACDAIYGGESSGHHYFRDFSYCDSGMIPWLLVWQILSNSSKSLSEILACYRKTFFSSGEINFLVDDGQACLESVKNEFISGCQEYDKLDGLNVSFDNWRFNLRQSNTEPLVRLNVESFKDKKLMSEKTNQLKRFITENFVGV